MVTKVKEEGYGVVWKGKGRRREGITVTSCKLSMLMIITICNGGVVIWMDMRCGVMVFGALDVVVVDIVVIILV
jgi:hypothetical protein